MDGEGARSRSPPAEVTEAVVPPGETDHVDAVWRLKEHIRDHDGALAQRRTFFRVQYRRCRNYLLFREGDLVGFAVVRPDGYLSLLGVAPEWRRRGLATRLVERAVADHDRLTCHVRATNDDALAFYADRGFAVEGRTRGYYRDGTDAYRLVHDPERAERLADLL